MGGVPGGADTPRQARSARRDREYTCYDISRDADSTAIFKGKKQEYHILHHIKGESIRCGHVSGRRSAEKRRDLVGGGDVFV